MATVESQDRHLRNVPGGVMGIVETELKRIYEESGRLVPEEVVESARLKSSPLHSRFEWDNKRAGHLYRVEQAREMIRRVEAIVYEMPVRRYVHIESDKAYHDVEHAMERHDWRAELLAEFERDAKRFQSRWATHRHVAEAYRRWVDEQTA